MLILIKLIIEITRRRRTSNRTKEKSDARYNCIRSIWSRSIPCQVTPPSLYTDHDTLCFGISLSPAQVSSPGHASSQLLVHLLTAEHGKLTCLCKPTASITQPQPKRQRSINTILLLNPKNSNAPATRKKTNLVPVKSRTDSNHPEHHL